MIVTGESEPKPTPLHVVYSDMADNINKVPFQVYVKESFSPVIHYNSEGKPIEPIRDFGPGGIADDICSAALTIHWIVAAIVGGHYLEFKNPADMKVVMDWLDIYLDQFKGVDLDKHPDVKPFISDARIALGMIRDHVNHHHNWQEQQRPKKLDIADIIGLL